ncbi:hypothetical protein C0Z17_21005 [Trinickia caryophylli]|nr:hypothetical protein C0Z17_21005 [Trinickia caryophylli]
MTESGRFVHTEPDGGALRINKDRADALCKLQAGFDDVDPKVIFHSSAADRKWVVGHDPATPHVPDIVVARKGEWTTFTYQFVDDARTLMTLRDESDRYLQRVDIGRPFEHLAASTASAEEAARFRLIRFASDDA